MGRYIARRLLILPFVLIGLSLMIFIMLQFLTPVERAALYVNNPPRTRQALQEIIQTYGLNQPIYIQYWNWLDGIFHGNLGWSKPPACL